MHFKTVYIFELSLSHFCGLEFECVKTKNYKRKNKDNTNKIVKSKPKTSNNVILIYNI